MDGYLKQSTASQTRWIGPFVDDTDFKTAETGLTIANTDIKVSKNGGSSASKNSGGGTHDVNGMYAVTWDATDTATVGELKYSVKVAGALQVFGSYVVLEEAVYDALFAALAPGYVANAPVNVAQFGGSNGTFASGRPEVNTTHAAGTAWGSGAITAASIAAAALNGKGDWNIGKTGYALSAAGVQAIWDAITSALTTAGSIGKRLVDNLTGDIYARIGAPAGASVSADIAAVKSQTAAIETDTQDIQARLPAALVGGRIDANVGAISADATAADNAEAFFDGTGYAGTNNVIPTVTNLTNKGDGSGFTAIPWNAAWDAEVQSEATDALNAYDPPTKAELDAAVDALPTAAENADAVWDEALAGHAGVGSTGAALSAAGGSGDPWATALPGAYGAGTAGKILGDNLNATVSSRASQTSVDDLPTNAELATALAAADDAVLAAIAALNNLSQANIRTAVGLATANLDTQLAAIDAKTTNLPSDPADESLIIAATNAISAAIAALNNLSAADVNAELLDVLTVDTFPEPSAVPSATSTLKDRIAWLAMLARNKVTQSSTTQAVRNDADSADVATAAVSDAAGVFTRGEWS